jgi:UDP:flavonoid glycosyltransferase YjiC (YdhE family)
LRTLKPLSGAVFDVAPKAIPHAQLDIDSLSQAIEMVVSDANIRSSAVALGEQIRSEDGIQNAAHLTDEYLKQK